jgi:5-deoxy-glucuronate isomerase
VTELHRKAGAGADIAHIRPDDAGWAKSGLRVVDLQAGGELAFDTGGDEIVVVPLSGSATLDAEDIAPSDPGAGSGAGHAELAGRPSVFTAVSDVAYVPRDSRVRLRSEAGGRFAVAGARAETRFPFQHIPASAVPVELRGAGRSSRQVNNLGLPDVLDADRILVCEVLTPAGNWSSYPPHKHDQDKPGESVLEEIYYFEVDSSPEGAPGLAYQRVYASDDRPIDVLAEVRSGDVVLVPYGWHGPSMAVPGYDLYYLNVMAGPGERIWQVCDDPAHGWVRATWEDEQIDPRLPMTAAPAGEERP